MSWLLQQLDTLATVAAAICGWEGAKWIERRWKGRR
jgi:hypothetical protein